MLSGTKAANRIDGGSGADTIFGDAGADTLLGGDGNDVELTYPKRVPGVTDDSYTIAEDAALITTVGPPNTTLAAISRPWAAGDR